MERKKDNELARGAPKHLPKIIIPPSRPPTAEELERRRLLNEKTNNLRKRIGPLGFSLVDLIREDRETR